MAAGSGEDASGPQVRLILTSGPRTGEEIALRGEVSLGRAGTDIVIDDPQLSRRHVLLRPTSHGVYVEDLKSLNGTAVNGHALTGPVTVGNGARIQVGDTIVRVEYPGPPVGATKVARVAPQRPAELGVGAPQPTSIRRVAPQVPVATPGADEARARDRGRTHGRCPPRR